MKKEQTNTEMLIEYFKSNNFQFKVDNNPSEAKIAMIKAKIANSKKRFKELKSLREPDTIFTTKNGVEVKHWIDKGE